MRYINFWKRFLLKCFVISFLLNIVFFFWWLLVRDYSFSFAHQIFAIDKIAYNKLIVDFFILSKYIMFYLFLTPSLALYWMSKCYKDEWKKNIKLDD